MARMREKEIDRDEPLKIDFKKISFKEFFTCVKGYGVPTVLAPLFIVMEVILEVLIPIVMQKLIDEGIGDGIVAPNMSVVWTQGGIMLALAFGALITGALSASLPQSTSLQSRIRMGLRSSLSRQVSQSSSSWLWKYSLSASLYFALHSGQPMELISRLMPSI